jgi:heme-degrading monooxygenase HmoA
MWAQMISTRIKDGSEETFAKLLEQLRSIEQPGSGMVRSTAMRDQSDPSRIHLLVVFESEEAARARESDPRREAGLAEARSMMADIFAAPPEFTNLEVLEEYGGR